MENLMASGADKKSDTYLILTEQQVKAVEYFS